jgi:uncharacterized protein (DUF697 family)
MSSLGLQSVLAVLREMREGSRDEGSLALGGAAELVTLLARELADGGDETALAPDGQLEDAVALIWIGEPDETQLRAAASAGLAIVGVTDGKSLPYVLDTNLVVLEPGQGLPVDAIARALARALDGHSATSLAARLPSLRDAVIDGLIQNCARRNGLIAAAVFVPGADLPALTLNEIRLVLAIALANGCELGIGRVPDVLGVLGAGYSSRRLARSVYGLVPFGGFAVKGAVAYAATKAIGEAARTRFVIGDERSVRPRT